MTETPSTAWCYALRIAPQPWMVSLVRNSLKTALFQQHQPELVDTACLLASELATNSIVHSGLPVTVHMEWEDGRLRVGVHDDSPELPQQRTPEPGDEGGRGLLLVEACASAWGVRTCPTGPGKDVWFELSPRSWER
ncbi:ATP-binding protein [Wenjunlia tyrosinilytica]|uniref:Histidine kinase/HSP90-like ATPase domain-containing protein n=1 Tax=Wenjunlia tyrosinilytica TaxID=1544741 RepID=A0A917ZWY2_9ACTN|nr:ATP-binding protein [Wenjunlia tyrosinilytica]GGO97561.1 hypothetical protein GCM10012280_59650 [Wenjunlia tyrosinilytica]